MDNIQKSYFKASSICLLLAILLVVLSYFLSGCASSPSYLSNLGKCRLQAVQDFRFNDSPKRIVIGYTALGGHVQTELFRDGHWVPATPEWHLEMDHVFNTYYDLDSALKSGWLLR